MAEVELNRFQEASGVMPGRRCREPQGSPDSAPDTSRPVPIRLQTPRALDVDCRPTGRLRATVGRLRAELAALHARSVAFATLTHAAGISSTGDSALDRRLPFDAPYRIPPVTARAIQRVRLRGGRVVAVGTTVVRALEHAATSDGGVRAGEGLATQRIGAATRLRVVNALLTGTHEPGTSRYELRRAFTNDATLSRVASELEAHAYRTHEFGDSLLVERTARTGGAGTVSPRGGVAPTSGNRVYLACRVRRAPVAAQRLSDAPPVE